MSNIRFDAAVLFFVVPFFSRKITHAVNVFYDSFGFDRIGLSNIANGL